MSKSTRFLTSTVMAVVLLLIVLAGLALAKAPEAIVVVDDNVANSASPIRSTGDITVDLSIDYTPQVIRDFGLHTFTYTFSLHNVTAGYTPTVPFTVTLDRFLSDVGTLVPPATLVLPKVIVWTPELVYCEPVTLTITAKALIDEGTLQMGTLDMGMKVMTTTWESAEELYLDSEAASSGNILTHLQLYKLYLPIMLTS